MKNNQFCVKIEYLITIILYYYCVLLIMPQKSKYSNPPKSIRAPCNNYTGNANVIDSIPRHLNDERESNISVMRTYIPNRKTQRMISDMSDNGQTRTVHPSATCTIKGIKGM